MTTCATCFADESFCWLHCRNMERYQSWPEHIREQLAASPVTPWIDTRLLRPQTIDARTAAVIVGLGNGIRLGSE